jgi:2-alkenal reductase
MGLVVASSYGVNAQNVPILTDTEQARADMYARVSPSVVAINVDRLIRNAYQSYSSGSGFVVDTEGHIVTNNHVVDGGDRVVVQFIDGTIVQADIVGLDPNADIAVLDVDLPADRLSPVTFGDSDSLMVGQDTLAIGSPFGQKWTLTSGIISALDRRIDSLTEFSIGAVIQTDAAINPGNSGGPLLDTQGEVIGVNSQIISPQNSSVGVGFAVPSNLVQRVAHELIGNGDVQYSYLGINGGDVDFDIMEHYGLPNNLQGVIVSSVAPGSPAARGGLRDWTERSADIIIAIDDEPITASDAMVYRAIRTPPGQSVKMTVLRDGTLTELRRRQVRGVTVIESSGRCQATGKKAVERR